MCRKRRRHTIYSSLPAVRMGELRDEVDSGIEDRGSDSLGSSEGSDTRSSNSSLDAELEVDITAGMEQRLVDVGPSSFQNRTSSYPQVPVLAVQRGSVESSLVSQNRNGILATCAATLQLLLAVESKLTRYVQMILLRAIAHPVMLPQLVTCSCERNKVARTILRWTTRLSVVAVFVVILAGMFGAMLQLKPADHPPRFFDPDSNIQKLLDLDGNLTARTAINCWDCSAWYSDHHSGGGDQGGKA